MRSMVEGAITRATAGVLREGSIHGVESVDSGPGPAPSTAFGGPPPPLRG
jgi:hypothetical protein